MIHAKTSVADGLWSRVGSSNLNSWSLLGNWEIDVGVLDASLAGQLEGIFLADWRLPQKLYFRTPPYACGRSGRAAPNA